MIDLFSYALSSSHSFFTNQNNNNNTIPFRCAPGHQIDKKFYVIYGAAGGPFDHVDVSYDYHFTL